MEETALGVVKAYGKECEERGVENLTEIEFVWFMENAMLKGQEFYCCPDTVDKDAFKDTDEFRELLQRRPENSIRKQREENKSSSTSSCVSSSSSPGSELSYKSVVWRIFKEFGHCDCCNNADYVVWIKART